MTSFTNGSDITQQAAAELIEKGKRRAGQALARTDGSFRELANLFATFYEATIPVLRDNPYHPHSDDKIKPPEHCTNFGVALQAVASLIVISNALRPWGADAFRSYFRHKETLLEAKGHVLSTHSVKADLKEIPSMREMHTMFGTGGLPEIIEQRAQWIAKNVGIPVNQGSTVRETIKNILGEFSAVLLPPQNGAAAQPNIPQAGNGPDTPHMVYYPERPRPMQQQRSNISGPTDRQQQQEQQQQQARHYRPT